ncbi:MAG TPA: serine/threonine-protein kinase, partial [Planctomycetota bacterium]|nr:serine/threonine-protein kinase [Planctomycetota bacterium]
MVSSSKPVLRSRERLGKYRIEAKIADGGFATVYRAFDTIEGVRVALKIPYEQHVRGKVLDEFREEVRLAATLDHPNILPLKYADFIGERLVLVFPLGGETLADRLRRRVSLRTALDYAEQIGSALAYAHSKRIIHCDVKPENLILFDGNRVRLTDFGIAKIAQRTICASGSGTIGYIAPEQAMGKPSLRSDVFSAGLLLYRMLAGCLPEWPYDWPPPGYDRLRRRVHPDLIDMLKRAIEVDPRRRFDDAGQLLQALRRVRPRALRHATIRSRSRRTTKRRTKDWQEVRRQQFLREYGRILATDHACRHCGGPIAETMSTCPWCGTECRRRAGETSYPASCPRCRRGMKLDWKYCPWCYGPGFDPHTKRAYP